MGSGLQYARGDIALTLTAQGTGTVTSGPLANAGEAGVALVMVHKTAATGTGPTLDVSLEESNDGASWTALAGSGVTQMTGTGVGNAMSNAVPTKNFIRVTATVAGTTPAVTAKISVLVFGD